ncbi:tetratricopeptide repeat protein, partial [Candidatus Aminicenantes bacterium AC-334-K16]|nr:tetratricopeptide repeat protein [Candidatus Aminicenantes bacterium AC-334-K16]
LNRTKRFDECLKIIERLKDKEKFQFQYHLLRGQALMGKGLYGEAINELEKGNKIYNSDTSLLNSLGYCYYQSGQLQRALEVLQASLKLNQKQKDIQSLINEIETKLKKK